MLRLETGINALRLLQAAQEQTRANQQDERQRDLRDDQQIAQAEAPRDGTARPRQQRRLILEGSDHVRLRGLQRGREAEDEAGQYRQQQREAKHNFIQPENEFDWKEITRRRVGLHGVNQPDRKQQARRAAD